MKPLRTLRLDLLTPERLWVRGKLVMTERNTQMSDTISILDGFPIGQKFSQGLLKLSPLSYGEHHPAMDSGTSDLFPPWITIITC